MLETKEGMPSGASPSLVAWVFLEYYHGVPWALMTHKYRGSIVVLPISKSVEPNEEQKEMTSGFQ